MLSRSSSVALSTSDNEEHGDGDSDGQLLLVVGKILLFLLQQTGLETISHIPDYLGISLYLFLF